MAKYHLHNTIHRVNIDDNKHHHHVLHSIQNKLHICINLPFHSLSLPVAIFAKFTMI